MIGVLLISAISEANLNEVLFLSILFTPSRHLCLCINLSTTVGNFDHFSIATSIYASLFNSSERGPAKSNCTSPSRVNKIRMNVACLLLVSHFYLIWYFGYIFVPFVQLSGGCGETRFVGRFVNFKLNLVFFQQRDFWVCFVKNPPAQQQRHKTSNVAGFFTITV